MRVSLYDLNDNVLVLISTYLTLRDIISCRLSSKTLSKQFQNDIIWQQIVLEELGMNELTAPPDDMFPIPSTYESMYRDWMMSFPEYSAVEIKIVTVWWKRMGKWLRQNAPPIYATLNKPPTNQQWEKLVETGFKVPYYMKLLYRFHNGQKLRNGAETRLGLFGCYDFYSEEFNFYFLNLKNISEAELNIFTPHPSSPTAAYYVPSTPFICNQDSQQNISFRTVSSNVLQEKDLSVTTPENETEKSAIRKSDKLLCVFGDRRCMSEHVVPANTSYDLNYPTIFPKVVPNKSALFAWLYEYLYRLESGVYRYRHVHAFDEISTPCKSISLFPSCTSTGANSGDVKFVRTVTDGVEVTASWIYLPIIST